MIFKRPREARIFRLLNTDYRKGRFCRAWVDPGQWCNLSGVGGPGGRLCVELIRDPDAGYRCYLLAEFPGYRPRVPIMAGLNLDTRAGMIIFARAVEERDGRPWQFLLEFVQPRAAGRTPFAVTA